MRIRGIQGAVLIVLLACACSSGTEVSTELFSLGISARALGLAGAFTALVDDEASVLYNPAALGFYRGFGLTSLYAAQFGGVAHGAVNVAAPYAGAAILILDSGWIAAEGGGFRYTSQALVGGVGIPLGAVAVGARARFLRVSSPFSGSGWSIDPAIVVDIAPIRVGLVYEGALSGSMVYLDGSEEDWPRELRLGASATLSPIEEVLWSVSFDGIGLLGSSPRVSLGIETWIAGLGARMGYDGFGPTFGLSVRFAGLELDWAYASRDDLGDSHRVSLVLRF